MTEDSTPSRLRNARACEACRASKSRCVYSQEKDICRRCEQIGSSCIVRMKARPMRSKASQSTQSAASLSSSKDYVLELPALPPQDLSNTIEELENHHKALFDQDVDVSSQKPSSSSNPPSLLFRPRKVTLEHAETLLHEFQELSPWFPFVTIPAHASVSSLCRDSPFLFLAIITVASRSETSIHYQLDHEFRRVLSQKVVVEGRKSLELLQGLLVYLAWTPMPSGVAQNHTFVYLNMANGLVSDLGLDDETPNPHRFIVVDDKNLVTDGEFSRSAKEAYLGLQYLVTTLSTLFRKFRSVQGLSSRNYWLNVVAAEQPAEELYHMVKLNRFWERIVVTSSPNTQVNHTEGAFLSPEMRLQISLSELQEIIRSTPRALTNAASIGLQERFARLIIYAYHLNLDLDFTRNPSHKEPPQPHPENITHDFQCLEACKAFFEYMLSVPPDDFLCFTIVQWSFMAQGFVILSRLTFAMAADLNWDVNTTRQNIPMMIYLESLCWRFQTLSKTSDDAGQTPSNPDWVYVMRRILQTLSKSYSKRVAAIKPRTPAADNIMIPESSGMCPMKDAEFNSFLEAAFAAQVGGEDDPSTSIQSESSYSSSASPMYFDIWSTMTGSWADGG